jgi:general secretion pathway protein J
MKRCFPSLYPAGGMRRHGGFTLVEMLVAMTLLSLLVLAMGSALRATAQTEERVDQRLARNDELRVTSGFLQSVLGRVSGQRRAGITSVDESPFLLRANAQELIWVGVMPARYGVAGRQFFRLSQLNSGNSGALLLQFMPMDESILPTAWDSAATEVLVRDLTDFSLQYQDAGQDKPEWQSVWESKDRFPTHVLVSLATRSNGVWPPLVVAMRPLIGSDPLVGGTATFGGGR